jgi:hypothetical protein
MLMSRHQNTGQNHTMNIATGWFENVETLKCVEGMVTSKLRS